MEIRFGGSLHGDMLTPRVAARLDLDQFSDPPVRVGADRRKLYFKHVTVTAQGSPNLAEMQGQGQILFAALPPFGLRLHFRPSPGPSQSRRFLFISLSK